MSSYSDMANDRAQIAWVEKWVPHDEELPDLELEQYRFTLARARAAEAELKLLQGGLREFHNLVERAIR